MGNNFLADTPGEHTENAATEVVALGTDYKKGLFVMPFKGTFVKAEIVPQAAVSGDATDYYTLSIFNGGQVGTTETLLASKAYTAGVDSVAYTIETLTTSSTEADLALEAGDVIMWDKTEANSGLATVQCAVTITFTAR